MAIYNEKLGEMTHDNLIADISVKLIPVSGTIAAGAGELKRGTVLALTDGKLAPMNTGLTPYGVLCDAVTVGDADEVVEVYVAGQFNKGALFVAEGYELTAADINTLRNGGIFVENAM